jgi:crotonobetainyl-CoA:carnitine CoA-transferase CaiB-like acyl-CoA transferase
VNQGKRSLRLDLKSERGRELYWKLAASADVVVHNIRPGVLERLGLGHEQARARNPGIIYCGLSAYEGPTPGPRSGWAGYDPVLQAATGIMTRYGSPEQPEMHAAASCVDYLTGFLGAYGAALALLLRERSPGHEGSQVHTSLAQGAQLAQVTHLYSHAGRTWSEPSGQGALGEDALSRLHRAADGWFFVAVPPEQTEAFFRVVGLPAPAPGAAVPAPLAQALVERLRQRSRAHWVAALRAEGFGAHEVLTLAELKQVGPADLAGLEARAADMACVRRPHASGTEVETVAPRYVRSREVKLKLLPLPPLPGADTRATLLSLGLTPQEVDALVREGVVATDEQVQFLPS